MNFIKRQVYRCNKCHSVQMMRPEYAGCGCLLCDGQLEPMPDNAINYEVPMDIVNRVKRWLELKAQYQQEAGK